MHIISLEDYRKSKRKSYSYIKDFLKDRRKFYKKHVLNEDVEFESTQATRLGDAADCLLFTPGEFDNRFHVSSVDKTPSGKGLDFIKSLFQSYRNNPDRFEDDFVMYAEVAYSEAGLTTPKFENYITKFYNSDMHELLKSWIAAEGKTTLSHYEASIAHKIKDILVTHPTTSRIFNSEGYGQLSVFFDYDGEEYKAMLDRVSIDHGNQVIKPFDLKVTYEDEGFEYNWLKNYYYIQQGIYEKAIEVWRNEYFPDYVIDPFRFVVINSDGQSQPLVYEIETDNGSLAEGFITMRGGNKKGFAQLARDINWHINSNIWDVSKDNYDAKNYIRRRI